MKLRFASHSQPLFALTRAGFIDKIGMENICGDLDSALDRAREIIASKK